MTIPLIVCTETDFEGIEARNKIMEVSEKDIRAMIPGTLTIGKYYLRCYITESKKNDYLYLKKHIKITITITTDDPEWRKDTTIKFRPDAEQESEYLDFPYDFSYDYDVNIFNKTLINRDYISSEFKMLIYGPCINPSISIGGQIYKVNRSVADGEYIEIDSIEKTVYLIQNTGQKVNCYKDRGKTNYIFQKIPYGSNAVSWEGDFSFDVILKEGRSEPKWS